MYIIDQQALYRQIQRRAKQADLIAKTNEWGMMVIAVITSVLLLWVGKDTVAYQIVASVTMLGTGVYVFWQRRLRLASLSEQPDSILGELDQALTNANYLVRFAQTFAYWFLLPTAAVTIFRMTQKEVDVWRWLFILGAFLLSFLIVRWELISKHRPRKRALEELKETLTREVVES